MIRKAVCLLMLFGAALLSGCGVCGVLAKPTPTATAMEGAPTPTPLPPTAPPPTVTPPEIPSPPPESPVPAPWQMQLAEWPRMELKDWPRPANDNGRGMHFLTEGHYTEEELDRQISRLVGMGMRWALVLYSDENQLQKAAIKFKAAGITVVWRKVPLRPFESYYDWGRDVEILRGLDMPPYMQLYNEPSLPAEWEGESIDKAEFMANLLQAVEQVYNAGGYVGLQFVNGEWLADALNEIKVHGGEAVFGRMFFVPHPYGMNHPPSYVEDPNGVLGFLFFADIFKKELGLVPPMIAGEGGWKINAEDDNRFPKITDELHRDYHVELFNWFRTGKLSNGEELPDYLFAFCPWLISAGLDDNAWYDSFAGERSMTIEAVKNIPPFVRQFSWER